MGADALGVVDAGGFGEAADDAPGDDSVEGGAVFGDEDWSCGALTDAGLEGDEDVGGQGRGGALVARAAVAEHAVAVGDGQVFDTGVERLADP